MPLDLQLVGVSAYYDEMPALFDVDLAVPHGLVTAVLGPNGAGKTTTLRVATGILTPRVGTVRFLGEDVTRVGVRALAARGLCMIPEGRGVFPSLSVKENLLLHTHLRGRAGASAIEERAYQRFPVLGQRRHQLAGTMSGGEQQMLALSRALTTDPKVVLLDEISMGLAPLVVTELLGVVRQLAAEGTTIVMVEQLARDALEIADYVYLLSQGRIRGVGQPADMEQAIFDSYLGASAVDGSHWSSGLDAGQLYMTAAGTQVHRSDCVVLRSASTSLRPVPQGGSAPRCALCDPVAVAA